MDVGQLPAYLLGSALIRELHHTQSRRACQYVAVLPFQEAVGIALSRLPFQVAHLHIVKLLAIPSLQSTVHAEIEQSAAVLHDGVHIVAGQGVVLLVLTFEHAELVTVVAVNTVTGSGPKVAVTVNIYLRDIAAGQLSVGIEVFAHLSMYANGQEQADNKC